MRGCMLHGVFVSLAAGQRCLGRGDPEPSTHSFLSYSQLGTCRLVALIDRSSAVAARGYWRSLVGDRGGESWPALLSLVENFEKIVAFYNIIQENPNVLDRRTTVGKAVRKRLDSLRLTRTSSCCH